MWSKGNIFAEQCPISLISGESASWVRLFLIWRSGVIAISQDWWAKDLEALAVLRSEEKEVDCET